MVVCPPQGERRGPRERGARRRLRPGAPAGSAASRSPSARGRGAAVARGVPSPQRRSFALRRLSPPPARRGAAATRAPQTRSARLTKSSEISTAARDRSPAPGSRASPPRPQAPQPARRRKELALISEFSGAPQPSAAPRTWQTHARGLVEIKVSPPSPTRKIASFDPCGSATPACSARPSRLPLFSGERGRQ